MTTTWYDEEEEEEEGGSSHHHHHRLLVAPVLLESDPGNDHRLMIQLRHPKTGENTCYILINNSHIHEVNWLKQSCYSSWFIHDYISQDGGLYAATPVDPVFILLPLFHQARINNKQKNRDDDDPGMFKQLDDIIYIQDYPGYHHFLSNLAQTSMERLCDSKEIGSTKFFRLNDSKVLAWLYCKVQQLKQTLVNLDNNYAARTQKDTLADVVMILGEYLADDPWLKLLCNNLRLNIGEVVQAPDTKIQLPAPPKIDSSFNPIQDQTGRVTRNGKQNKKAKVVEKNSHNIKDMFTRASRRGR